MSIIHGDCLGVMRGMDANSVNAIVTDPPYGLGFMGKDWDDFGMKRRAAIQVNGILPAGGAAAVKWEPRAYQEWCRTWAAEALRVAKPGAHLLAFGGTRTFHRLTCAIEDAGWEIRDCLGWIYGSGFPKSHNLKGEHEGWGTALKPAWEPIILARKPLDGTVSENVQKWGTGAINVDGCRVGTEVRIDSAKRKAGPYADDRTWSTSVTPPRLEPKPYRGRWPANLLHDGSEEVLALFPDANGGAYPTQRGVGRATGFGAGRPTDGGARQMGDPGSAARFFYCAKASRKEREMGCEGMGIDEKGYRWNKAGEWTNETTRAKNHHPTVKPLALMRYLCRLVTPPNGLILDPFAGSGTTLIAAEQEGFRASGIELNDEYCEIANKRLGAVAPLRAPQEANGNEHPGQIGI